MRASDIDSYPRLKGERDFDSFLGLGVTNRTSKN